MPKKPPKAILYLMTYLILVCSTLAFFKQDFFRFIFVLVSLFLFIAGSHKVSRKIIWVIIFLLIIIYVQSIRWQVDLYTTITTIIYMAILPYILLKIIGLDYPKFMVRIIYYYAIISLLFWTASNISPAFYNYTEGLASALGTHPINPDNRFAGNPEQFILYTFEPNAFSGLIRNPGPFHEPGAFAVFLIFGIAFNIIMTHKLFEKKNIILCVALITTFSTSGILALMVLIIAFPMLNDEIKPEIRVFLSVIIIPLIIYLYFNVDIFGDKISEQYENAQNVDLETRTSGRLLGARKAIYVLTKYPLTGRGLLSVTKADFSSAEGVAYGFMSFASRIGIFGIMVYFFFFFKTIKQYCVLYNFNVKFAIFSFIALLMVLFAQTYAETPVFVILFLTSFIWGNFGAKIRSYNSLWKMH